MKKLDGFQIMLLVAFVIIIVATVWWGIKITQTPTSTDPTIGIPGM